MTQPTEPTARDRRNAALRQEFADRQQREYDRVLLWAMGKFGTGWQPCGRHYLLDHDEDARCRKTGERPVATATCYTVRSEDGRKRHFTVDTANLVTEHENYQAAFGPMLLEPHPTHTIEVKGQKVHPHRYLLCWAPIETYQPRTAEELAKLRVNREKGKAERAERKFAEDFPLYTIIDRAEEEGRGR